MAGYGCDPWEVRGRPCRDSSRVRVQNTGICVSSHRRNIALSVTCSVVSQRTGKKDILSETSEKGGFCEDGGKKYSEDSEKEVFREGKKKEVFSDDRC
jgi:hypothetical protein